MIHRWSAYIGFWHYNRSSLVTHPYQISGFKQASPLPSPSCALSEHDDNHGRSPRVESLPLSLANFHWWTIFRFDLFQVRTSRSLALMLSNRRLQRAPHAALAAKSWHRVLFATRDAPHSELRSGLSARNCPASPSAKPKIYV